jgi:hypothetical protein
MFRPLAGRNPAPPACGAMIGRPVSAAVGVFSSVFSCLCRFFPSGFFLWIFGSADFFLGFSFIHFENLEKKLFEYLKS